VETCRVEKGEDELSRCMSQQEELHTRINSRNDNPEGRPGATLHSPRVNHAPYFFLAMMKYCCPLLWRHADSTISKAPSVVACSNSDIENDMSGGITPILLRRVNRTLKAVPLMHGVAAGR
jgi:hypothetical protein